MSAYTDTILPIRHGRGLPRWAIAALIVLAAHLGIAIFIIVTRTIDVPAGVPTDTVMIDLAPVATQAAQPQAETAPPQQEMAQPEPTPPTPPPPPEPPPPEPVLQSVPETPPVMVAPQPPPPAPSILQTPDLPPAPNAEAVLPPPPPPKPVVDQQAEQQKLEQQQKLAEQKKLERQKQIAERQKQIERERLRKEKAERTEKAAKARAAAQASRASRSAGPAPGSSGMSISTWQSIVQARVNGAASSMRGSGESGTASIAFTVNASGGVGGARIAGSSGNPSLDRMALSITSRIGRLPPPPNGSITVRVPVHFH